jgi:hypothetical protein
VNHGPRGIQQKRRLFEIGEETAGSTGQRGKGKGKTPEQKERDRLRKIEYRKENRGMIRAYNVAKHATRRPDIEARKAARAEQKRQQELWAQYQRACMDEIRQHRNGKIFPDWGHEWNKETSRRNSSRYYNSLTEEERKDKSRRQIDNRSPEQQRKYSRAWRAKNPEKAARSVRRAIRKRKLIDPGFRAQCNLRNRFKEIMGVVLDPTRKWNSSLIACNTQQLARHLEAKFKKGMTWENYGTHWHVDHIVPVSKFDHTIPAHVRQCWHYTNLQPLEASVNLAKSDKILNDSQLSLTL